jgi:ADP-ribose pyrophosphatase YjhB (NUDIX family)
MERARVDCVGGIVIDGLGRFLLIRRGREPDKGRWSIPGGKVEPGETDAQATAREVLEETGLAVEVGGLVGAVERDGPAGVVYDIRDYACTVAEGADPVAVRAGDDADDAGWFTAEEMRGLGCSALLLEAFEEWGLLR